MMESLHSSHVDVVLTLEDHMFCSVLMEGGIIIPQSVHQSLKSVTGCVATSGMYKLTLFINVYSYPFTMHRFTCILNITIKL